MEWDRGLTRAQLVQRRRAGSDRGSLLGGVDLFARAGDAFARRRPSGRRRHFVSRPDLRPPKLTVLRRGKTGAGPSLPRAVVRARPARRADRRLGRRAGLVPPDDAADRDELPHRRLPRQAGADVVGGQGDERSRHRDARDPRRHLSRDRARPGGRRPAVGPARVPDHAREHRAPHELRDPRRRPHARSAARRTAR